MKTKNEVLMVCACMMMFFRENNTHKVVDLLSDDEMYLFVDQQIDLIEQLYVSDL